MPLHGLDTTYFLTPSLLLYFHCQNLATLTLNSSPHTGEGLCTPIFRLTMPHVFITHVHTGHCALALEYSGGMKKY